MIFNKKLLSLIILCLASFVFLLFFIFKKPSAPLLNQAHTPLTVPTDVKQDYSKVNQLKPGLSIYDDVIRINGYPLSSSKTGERTYLSYPTPLKGFTNTVLLKNNKVEYVVENVFGDYRGFFADYQNKYGDAPLKLHKDGDPYTTWHIYPNNGFGIESDDKDVLTILYFVPISESDFLKSDVAFDLRLSTNQNPISE